jgi:AsmA family/AsmA-like C-terminal region
MSARSGRRLAAALALFLLAALVLPPLVSVGRFRVEIASSISRALGREVTVGRVSMRVLPQPGIDLRQFVVAEDPSFGAEPMLRANSVYATLRLSSLWRGRLEIGSLSLEEPSLNLVRRSDGQWNLAALLERNASIPTAPTAVNKPEARPRFPYIQAENGRINFKIGPEKKVYAFTDADFALWLASENSWSLRLEGRPVRTDGNLTDTGRLGLTGSFQRSASAHETPFRLDLRLQRAQLGQLTRLVYGRDRGWRGTVDLSARLEGTPAAFSVRWNVSLDEFRRYDIFSNDRLRLAAQCSAQFSTTDSSWDDVLCTAPIGDGLVTVTGSGRGVLAQRRYDLRFVAQHVPMAAVVAAARHAKKDLPLDLTATGDLGGTLLVSQSESSPLGRVWAGGGQASGVKLISHHSGGTVDLGTIPFSIADSPESQLQIRSPFTPLRPGASRLLEAEPSQPRWLRVAVGPFPVELGRNSANVEAVLSTAGYDLHLAGAGDLQHIFALARSLGLHTADAQGAASFSLEVAGPWSGFAAPVLTGTAQLTDVSARLRGFSQPLAIGTADLTISPAQVAVRNLQAGFSAASRFSGSLELPRDCFRGQPCAARVFLRADQVSAADLGGVLDPQLGKQPWYNWFERGDRHLFASLQAAGSFAVARLVLGNFVARNVAGELEVKRSKFRLSRVQAEFWGGRHEGEWVADYSGSAPAFSGSGTLSHASLAQLISATGENWGVGSFSARYTIAAAGSSPQELLGSAKAAAQIDLRNGMLRRLSLDGGPGPLPVRHFSGRLAFKEGAFRIVNGELQSGNGAYEVSGTARLDSSLDIRLVGDGARAFTITGTLAAPRVEPRPQAEAALKP